MIRAITLNPSLNRFGQRFLGVLQAGAFPSFKEPIRVLGLAVVVSMLLPWVGEPLVDAKPYLERRFVDQSTVQKTPGGLTHDIQLGSDIDTAIRQVYKPSQRYGLQQYLTKVVAKLAAQSPVYYPFTVIVLSDQRSAMAISAPGGFIYVTEGLLYQTESESELAALLAIQMAYVVKRQMFQLPQVMDTTLQSTFFQGESVAGNADYNQLTAQQKQAFRWVHTLLYQSYLESEVLAASSMAQEWLPKAGYDPSGLTRWVQKQVALQGRGIITDYHQTSPMTEPMALQLEDRAQLLQPRQVATPTSSTRSFRQYTPAKAAQPSSNGLIQDTPQFHDLMD